MDGSGSPWLGFIVFLAFVIVDAILYGFGAAIQSIGDSEIEKKKKEGEVRKASWVEGYKNAPEHLINTIQVAATLLCMLTGSVAVQMVFVRWHSFFETLGMSIHLRGTLLHILTAVLVLFLFLFFMYTFGIHLPKILGSYHADSWAFSLAGPVRFLERVFSPLTWLLVALVHGISRICGVDPDHLNDDVTEEEIISMVNEGHEQGVLEENEAEMINNIFELGDKEAQDIMTHRKNIVAVDGKMSLRQALEFMLDGKNSRFPVYEENIDNIIGILHLKDAMKYHTKGKYDSWLVKDIPNLIRPAVFIPETRNISQLFTSMQTKKLQMVMVADEYGQTAGLVALEDILEEIVGNIQDEYDVEEDLIRPSEDGGFIMDGMAPLEDVEESLGIELEEEDFETLNGFLIAKLDRIPSENEHSVIEAGGYAFRILSVAHRMIQKVRVTKLLEEELPENGRNEKLQDRKGV